MANRSQSSNELDDIVWRNDRPATLAAVGRTVVSSQIIANYFISYLLSVKHGKHEGHSSCQTQILVVLLLLSELLIQTYSSLSQTVVYRSWTANSAKTSHYYFIIVLTRRPDCDDRHRSPHTASTCHQPLPPTRIGSSVVQWLGRRTRDRQIVGSIPGRGIVLGGKLFTSMCFCSPSSIIWYLARAFMSTRRMWQPWHGFNEQGEYCSKRFSSDDRLEPLYKCSTLLLLFVSEVTA